MIYLCSDWHFSHNKDFLYAPRGFTSIEEMNAAIIENHNKIVSAEDDVYVLGDCCMGDSSLLDLNKSYIESLNGKLHIVTGNHCTNKKIELYSNCKNVVEIKECAMLLKYKKYHFYLSHYPTMTSNLDIDKPLYARVINLCGHSHTKDKFEDFKKRLGLIYHVEMDAHENKPVSIDNIIEDIKSVI